MIDVDKTTFEEEVLKKLKEAELEMDNTDIRYTLDDIKESMNKIFK